MASSTPNTITLKNSGVRKEKLAGGAITPGHLITVNSSDQAVVHPTAGGNARKAFAVENDLIGNGIGDAYASGDTVQFEVYQPGDEVYALVPAAAAAIVIGDALESNGDGTLVLEGTTTATGDTDIVVGYALEAVDNSGGGAVARIKIEVA